jgi:predicted dehydrogenase
VRILVVGAGMYVLGRGTTGLGTVLPALAQASKETEIEQVLVCSTSDRGYRNVEAARTEVNRRLGADLSVSHRVFDEVLPAGTTTVPFDCAIVCVPDDMHYEIGCRVLEAGLHCLIVKPLTLHTHQAKSLIQLAEARGLYGAVEFHKRFDETNRLVHRLLLDGRIGYPSYAAVEYSQRISVPSKFFSQWAARTNVFHYLGVHYVDLLHFLTGDTPSRVTAHGQKGILAKAGIDTYDSVHVMLKWTKPDAAVPSFISQFAVGWIDPESSTAMSDQRFVIVGSNGRIDCDQKHRGLTLTPGNGPVEAVNPYFSEYLTNPGEQVEFAGYGYKSIRRFVLDVEDLKGGQAVAKDLEGRRPTFRSGYVSTAVLQAVQESLESGSDWKDVDAAL